VAGTDWDVMRHTGQKVKFFDGNGIDFVYHIYCRNISYLTLYYIDKIIRRRSTSKHDISISSPELSTYTLDGRVIKVRAGYLFCDGDSSRVLFPEDDVWWILVKSNAESFQFPFNDFLVN